MSIFEIVGKGKDTGRTRRHKFEAKDEAQARMRAEAEGTEVESVTNLGPRPPTEPQLEYAQSLGVKVPDGASFYEVSDLITNANLKLSPAPQAHINIAKELEYEATRFCSTESLEERLFKQIGPFEQCCLYLFLLLKTKSPKKAIHEFSSPNHPEIKAIAKRLQDDPKFLKSLYGKYDSLSFNGIEPSKSYAYTRAALELKPLMGKTQQTGVKQSESPGKHRKHTPVRKAYKPANADGMKPLHWLLLIAFVLILYSCIRN